MATKEKNKGKEKEYSRNKLKLQQGNINGKQLRYLGHVQECHGEDCAAYSLCTYQLNKEGAKCAVMDSSIKSIYQGLIDPIDGIGDVLTQLQLDRIGMHLVPLYQQLIKFFLETVTLRDSTYKDKSGKVVMYPQFKEIRDVQSCIAREIKDIGLNGIWQKKFGNEKGMPGFDDQDLEDMMMHGKKGAYESILED